MFEKWESRLGMAEDEVYLALILKTDNIKIKKRMEEVKMRIKTSRLLRVILLCMVAAVLLGAGSVEGATAVTYVVATYDSVNPRADYTCTETDGSCIQNAIDAITGVGGKIALLDGTYNISSPINISKKNITIVGAGRSATRLVAQNSMPSVINIDGNIVKLANFVIKVEGNYSIDSVINITGNRAKLEDFWVMVQNAAPVEYGVITKGGYTTVTHVRIQGFIKGAIKFDGPTDSGHDDKLLGGIVENSHFLNTVGYANNSGVEIYGAAARITIKNNTFEDLDNAIYAHEVGIKEEDIFIDGNNFTNSGLHFCENGNGDITAPLRFIIITNNHIYDSTLLFDAEIDGGTEWRAIIANNTIMRKSNKADTVINLEYGSANIVGNLINLGGVTEPVEEGGIGLLIGKEGSSIIGNTFNSGETRIKLGVEAAHTTIIGNKFLYMGYCLDSTTCREMTGIELSVDNVTINGNVFGTGARGLGGGPDYTKHYYGIKGGAGSSTITGNTFEMDKKDGATFIDIGGYNNIIMNNSVQDCLDNPSAPCITVVTDDGTDNIIKNNLGYNIIENSGTATILSGNTSVSVNHGSYITPSISDITVVPTNNMGNAYKFWVSNVTADTFDINVDVDPGAGGAEFSWQIGGY